MWERREREKEGKEPEEREQGKFCLDLRVWARADAADTFRLTAPAMALAGAG